jgi:UDP-glucose 4-epimerase
LKPEYRPARAVANVSRRQASIAKAESLLGFRAAIGLEDGLRRLIDWRDSSDVKQTLAAAVRS